MSLLEDDADWEDAEADMPSLEVDAGAASAAMGLPVSAPPPQATGLPPQFGGMPRPGGPPQQIDPKLVKRWATIYPCYVNPRKKVSEGRRLPIHLLAGCEDAWPQEIAESLGKLGFKIVVMEGKGHPQDWLVRGRVRVELHDDKGVPAVPEYAHKHAVLKAVAKLIPSSNFRANRLIQQARQLEYFKQQQAAAAAAAAASPKSPAAAKKEDVKALTAGSSSADKKKKRK